MIYIQYPYAKPLWKGLLFAGLWCFWLARNSGVYNNRNTPYSELWNRVIFLTYLWITGHGCYKDLSISDLQCNWDINFFFWNKQLGYYYSWLLAFRVGCFCCFWWIYFFCISFFRMCHSPILYFLLFVLINSSFMEKKLNIHITKVIYLFWN